MMVKYVTHYMPWTKQKNPIAWTALNYVIYNSERDYSEIFRSTGLFTRDKSSRISEQELEMMVKKGEIIKLRQQIMIPGDKRVQIDSNRDVYIADLEDPENDNGKIRIG
jgi:hypothetical protein